MTAKFLEPTPENITFLGERLRAGEIVAMPTETVYGLAANVWDESALAQVFAVKERPKFDPLICHVALEWFGSNGWLGSTNGSPQSTTQDSASHTLWLPRLVELGLLNESVIENAHYQDAERLAERLWPGPLTLVLPKSAKVSDLATSGLDTLAIRVPRHPVAQALLQSAGVPLCAPSANRFGRISPTSAQDVADELGDRIAWILDGGPCEIGLESTVVAFESEPRVLRRGGIAQEELQAALGRPIVYTRVKEIGSGQLASPGMLASHYAPRKKLFLLPAPLSSMTHEEIAAALSDFPAGAKIGLLLWSGNEATQQQRATLLAQVAAIKSLSSSGNESEAARNLFRELRRLDADERTTHLLAEPPPNLHGLGGAILDRLARAAH